MTAAERPAAPRAGLLARHPLLFYFIIAYAGTWLVWMPLLVLSEDGTMRTNFREHLYSAALIQLFPAPSVLGSYLNLTMAAGALALVLVAVTRDRLGYQQEEGEEPDSISTPT